MLGSVGHACYIHRDEGYDQTDGQSFNWTAKTDLFESQMIVGEGAAKWAHEYAERKDYVGFWEQYENCENQYLENRYARQDWDAIEEYKAKAPIYFRETIALPIELSNEQNSELIKEFIDRAYTPHGITVQLAIHDDKGNPHAHIMGTVRRQTENGLGARFDDFGRYGDRKDRLREVRHLYASIGNQHLIKHGYEGRLDHRSYAEQGVAFEATTHEGWNARNMADDGASSRIVCENEDIKKRNAELAAQLPGAVIQELSRSRATFTESDLKAALFKRVDGDEALYQMAASKMMMHESLIHIGQDIRSQDRYTSVDYLKSEKEALASAMWLAARRNDHVLDLKKLDKRIDQAYAFVSDEQRAALHYVASGSDLSFIQGRAGAGKTTIMKIVGEEYTAQGFRVQGFALAGAAADNLERETGIPSRTIDSHIHQLIRMDKLKAELSAPLRKNASNAETVNRQKQQASLDRLRESTSFTDKDILIVDEGGMVGTKHYQHILGKAEDAGAKVIVIGDNAQLKAFSAGAFYDEMLQQHGFAELSEIRRQKVDWQREASTYLSEGETRAAMDMYHENGRIHVLQTDEQTRAALIDQYFSDYEQFSQLEEQLVMAATRADVSELNKDIRSEMVELGLVVENVQVGEKEYGVGDQIVFLSNDNSGYYARTIEGDGVGVKNGTRGVIHSIERTAQGHFNFHVKLHGVERTISFNPNDKSDFFDHGYAITNHKAQGATVERSYVLTHPTMREDSSYVAMTRHRVDVNVYASNDHFEEYAHVVEHLARTGGKDVALEYGDEYTASDEFRTLQDYHQLRVEVAESFTRISEESIKMDAEIWEHPEWDHLKAMRDEKMDRANIIGSDWERYSRLARQINLTREKVEIDAGMRERQLTEVEKKAISEVNVYVGYAKEARDQWNDIKATHPGSRSRSHENYGKFDQLRKHRNELAAKFLNDAGRYSRIMRHVDASWKTIKTQAQQYTTDKRRTELSPQNRAAFDTVQVYSKISRDVKSAYSIVKSAAGREGVPVHKSSKFKSFEGRRDRRDALASKIARTGGEQFLAEFKLKPEVVKQEAITYDLRRALKAYQASRTGKNVQRRDKLASHIVALVTQADNKTKDRAKAMLAKSGVSYDALAKQATTHDVRQRVRGASALKDLGKDKSPNRSAEKGLDLRGRGPSIGPGL